MMRNYYNIYRGIQETIYTGEYRGIQKTQKNTGEYRGIQGNTGESRRLQGNPRKHRGIQENTYILLDVLLCSIAEYFYELCRILRSP